MQQHFKVYIGKQDSHILKIGFTEQTCWRRCAHEDYHIFAAEEFSIWAKLTYAEILFLESYVRLAFNAMTETKQPLRQDYFILTNELKEMNENELFHWGAKWLHDFVAEAIEIINQKRHFSSCPPITKNDVWSHFGLVYPYTY